MLLLGSAALLTLVNACATNPVSGKKELALVSEAQEIEMGRQADREVASAIGLYPDDGWQRYVQQLGSTIAAKTERPHLPWTFRVVDDPAVNAFATPGGFVYVTRGILSHLNSEAELAAVLGHEIGHVTARHSVNQMSKQQLAQLGLGVALILSPDARPYGQLASQSLGLLFLKFSRNDESEADRLGLQYMVDRGYDPREMKHVFEVLERVSQTAGSGRLPQWASSHPDPVNRRDWAERAVATLGRDLSGLTVERSGYLRRLDGMTFGDNPREGFFEDNVFHHPDLRFRLSFPRGWKTSNQKSAVGALSRDDDARLVLELVGEARSAREAAEKFFSQQGIEAGQPWRREINGLPSISYVFSATTEQGQLTGLVAWIEHGGNLYRLLGFTPSARWATYDGQFAEAISSFERESDARVLAVQPKKLKIQELDRARSLEEFARQYPSAVSLETVALINNLQSGAQLAAGTGVKRVVD